MTPIALIARTVGLFLRANMQATASVTRASTVQLEVTQLIVQTFLRRALIQAHCLLGHGIAKRQTTVIVTKGMTGGASQEQTRMTVNQTVLRY
jgi:hypothetical protein